MPKAFAALAEQGLACIEDREVKEKMLTHLDSKDAVPGAAIQVRPTWRGTPGLSSFS